MSVSRFQVSLLVVVFVCLCSCFGYMFPVHSFQHTTPLSKGLLISTRLYDASGGSACGPCPNAPKCNGEFLNQGCDGTGKVLGGLASVPGFSWFPAKVYRPCPSYLKAGYVYRREGQTMDQVLFSEPSNKMKEKMAAIRASEWQDRQQVPKVDVSGSTDPENIDAAAKLLNDKFGKKE